MRRAVWAVLLIGLLGKGATTHATIVVDWVSDLSIASAGVVLSDGSTPFPVPPPGYTIGFYWSPSNSAFNVTADTWSNPPGPSVMLEAVAGTADEYNWLGGATAGFWDYTPRTYMESTYGLPNYTFQSGYVFQIAYELPFGALPSQQTYYAVSEVFTRPYDFTNGFTPDRSGLFDSGGDGNYRVQLYHVVPEPSSLALFGLGAAILALRKRFRKDHKA